MTSARQSRRVQPRVPGGSLKAKNIYPSDQLAPVEFFIETRRLSASSRSVPTGSLDISTNPSPLCPQDERNFQLLPRNPLDWPLKEAEAKEHSQVQFQTPFAGELYRKYWQGRENVQLLWELDRISGVVQNALQDNENIMSFNWREIKEDLNASDPLHTTSIFSTLCYPTRKMRKIQQLGESRAPPKITGVVDEETLNKIITDSFIYAPKIKKHTSAEEGKKLVKKVVVKKEDLPTLQGKKKLPIFASPQSVKKRMSLISQTTESDSSRSSEQMMSPKVEEKLPSQRRRSLIKRMVDTTPKDVPVVIKIINPDMEEALELRHRLK